MRKISLNDTLHGIILRALQPKIAQQLAIITHTEEQQVDEQSQLSAIFYNYRTKNGVPVGLRLSTLGNKLLCQHFNSYKYQHSEKLNHKTLLILDKNMKWPYYVSNTVVVFYNQEDAAWYKLNGQNLNNYVEYFKN